MTVIIEQSIRQAFSDAMLNYCSKLKLREIYASFNICPAPFANVVF